MGRTVDELRLAILDRWTSGAKPQKNDRVALHRELTDLLEAQRATLTGLTPAALKLKIEGALADQRSRCLDDEEDYGSVVAALVKALT